MKNKEDPARTPKELLVELKELIAEAESMAAGSLAEHSTEAFDKLRERFDTAHGQFSEFYGKTRERVVSGAKCTDDAIRANPYQSLAIATGIGLLLGVLVGRRGNHQ